jgi:hypothetical protein
MKTMDSGESLEKVMMRIGTRSKTKFAKQLEYSNLSSLQRYLKGGERAHKPLPRSLVKRLLDNVAGTGCPPVTRAEILEMGGIVSFTKSEHTDSVCGQDSSIITGDYIPVVSIMDVITMRDDDSDSGYTVSLQGYIFYNRPLKANERAIRLPDDSLAPTYPADAVAIVELGATPRAGKPALVKITEADGSQNGAIRLYSHKGHADDGSKIEAFEATNEIFPNYRTLPYGVFPQVEAVGRVTRVIITIEC